MASKINQNDYVNVDAKASVLDILNKLYADEIANQNEHATLQLMLGSIGVTVDSIRALTAAKECLRNYNKGIHDMKANMLERQLPSSKQEEALNLLDCLRVIGQTTYYGTFKTFVEFLLSQRHDERYLREIFYLGTDTEDQIIKRKKTLNILFHPDHLPRDLHVIANDVSQLCSNIADKMNENIHASYTSDDKYFEFLKSSAEFNKSRSLDFSSEIKIRDAVHSVGLEAAMKKNELTRHFSRLQGKRRELESLDVKKLKEEKLHHALKACGFYHSAIQMIDRTQDASLLAVNQRIHLRSDMAISQNLAGRIVEAQLYIIGAMNLALDLLPEDIYPVTFEGLRRNLHSIRGNNDPASKSPDTASSTSTDLALVPLSNSGVLTTGVSGNRGKARTALRKETGQWIAQQVIRADGNITTYQCPEDEILKTKERAFVFNAVVIGSGAVGVASLTVPVVIVGAVAAESLSLVAVGTASVLTIASGGAFGIAVCVVGFLAGILCGVKFYNVSRDAGKEPKRRELLNDNIKKAFQFYTENKIVEMMEALSTTYVDEQLFDFKKGITMTIEAPSIVEKLLRHGFRADGIAFILNIIADGLISGEVKLQRKGQSDLNAKARELFSEIVDNAQLKKTSEELDKRVFSARSEVNKLAFAQRFYLKIFDGIPENYFHDSQVAPFVARLTELQNIARMNLAILHIIEQNESDKETAVNFINEVKQSVESNYQYFSVNSQRLEAIEDFLAAVGHVASRPQQPTSQSSGLLLSLSPTKANATLRWGETSISCVDKKTLTSATPLVEVFNSHWTMQQIIEKLKEVIESETNFHNLQAGLTDANPDPLDLSIHNALLKMLNDDTGVPQATKYITPKFAKILSEVFSKTILFCKLSQNHYYLYSPSDSETAVLKTQYVFVVLDQNTKPVLSFNAKIPDARGTITEDVVRLLSEAKINADKAKYDLVGVERTNAWFKAAEKYQAALSRISSSWMFSVNILPFVDYAFKAEEVAAVVGRLEAEVNIGRYDTVINIHKRLQQYDRFDTCKEFWYWYAVATRKDRKYFDAAHAIHKALRLDANWSLAADEHKKITALSAAVLKMPLYDNVCLALQYPVAHNKVKLDAYKSSDFYDILSIDGGGIRGIIPAYILAEVERRAGVPLCHLFDMHTGTSTGGIIAAGLSLKDRNTNEVRSAKQLVELYSKPSNHDKIFQRSISVVFGGTKYTSKREDVLSSEFNGEVVSPPGSPAGGNPLRLHDAVNDLMVVAVNKDTERTHQFSSFDQSSSATPVVHALMASSAAPTFFPSYKIGPDNFVDGGLQANNPANLAMSGAIKRQIDVSKIRVWSLGCGDVVATNKGASDGLLYWASNGVNVAISGQQAAVDDNLSAILGNRYHRWQVWLDKAYPMDHCDESTLSILLDHARQYVAEHELEISEMVSLLRAKRGL